MSDESNRHDPFADVINILAAPIAGGLRSVEQFQRGIGELFRAVENLNRTLETLNETATRVNRLVGDVEGPIRALMPQITRTIEAADWIYGVTMQELGVSKIVSVEIQDLPRGQVA